MITRTFALLTLCLFSSLSLNAAIIVPGANGSSGVLNVTENTVIDLSLAVDGQWDDVNSSAGIYDADRWAVIFNYTVVNVAAGATLSFINHPSKAPVVWLVGGDVTIDGNVVLDGQNWREPPELAEGGPGGFRGGMATFGSGGPRASAGFGPGGGFQVNNNAGRAGAFGTDLAGSPAYGNPSLIPLVGGSGGAGDPGFTSSRRGGGGGGGALLIASAQTITINGAVRADGGNGSLDTTGTDLNSGGGSGGGLRFISEVFAGSGIISANGGGGWSTGGPGRVRVERVTNTNTSNILPGPSVVPLNEGANALIWPPSTAPTVRVVSVGGVASPADPRASFGAEGADMALSETTSAEIILETTNVEQASTVEVRLTPRSGANAVVINAAVDSVVSTTPLVIRWKADLPVSTGYSAVQARVIRP